MYIIAKCQYLDVESFLADLDLISHNSELFNGPTSDITKQAKKMVSLGRGNIMHDRMTYGEDNDIYLLQEKDIRVK